MNQQKYVLSKRGETQKVNDWYGQCQKEKIPYIVVNARTKYADVRFDYISLPKEYDEHLKKHSEIIAEKAIQIFRQYAIKKSRFELSSFLINYDDLPIEQAENAASDVYDLISSFIPG